MLPTFLLQLLASENIITLESRFEGFMHRFCTFQAPLWHFHRVPSHPHPFCQNSYKRLQTQCVALMTQSREGAFFEIAT